MRVAVVLDATAVVAYARGSVAVGEVLVEIIDARDEGEAVCVALPAASYLAAVTADTAVDVRRLARHPAVVVVSTRHDHVEAAGLIAVALRVPGEVAGAAVLAAQNEAALLTAHGAALRSSQDPVLAELPIDIRDDFRDV